MGWDGANGCAHQATVSAMGRALALMTDVRVSAWLLLLDCCPAPPPAFVVEACTAAVESDPDRPDDTTYLMQRLVAHGGTDAAYGWAARDDVAAALRPMLAMEGDVAVQRLLVGELLENVRGGLRATKRSARLDVDAANAGVPRAPIRNPRADVSVAE